MKKRKQPTATPTPSAPATPPKPKRSIADMLKEEGIPIRDVTEQYLGKAIQIIEAPGNKRDKLRRG
jgi:hypothetical protein